MEPYKYFRSKKDENVAVFNDCLHVILLDISGISKNEQTDCIT